MEAFFQTLSVKDDGCSRSSSPSSQEDLLRKNLNIQMVNMSCMMNLVLIMATMVILVHIPTYLKLNPSVIKRLKL